MGCHLDAMDGCQALIKSGERALGGVLSKIKQAGDVGYKTFETLYTTCVNPVLDYCGGIWGISPADQKKFVKVDKVTE